MKTTVEKSDFVLTPYMKSNDLRASYQIFNTVVPYMLLWVLAVKAVAVSLLLLPPIIVLLTLFSLRCFSLMHDCGHYSLFRSKQINRIVGFMLGVINAIPQYAWSRDHAYHHKTNGNWEKYRGVADFLSTEEFAELNSFHQRLYELLRHPLMAIPGGFFYLAIKPRLALVAGSYDFIKHLWTSLHSPGQSSPGQSSPSMNLSKIISSHQSKNWHTAAEFWDLLFNNLCVVGGWIWLGHWLGSGFLSVYAITLTCSATIFIWVFFVQHIFDGTYAHQTAGWDYLKGAIEGSSYLDLPPILRWFTADISYHNIHHLSERIPNYNLKACHYENLHRLSTVKTLWMGDLLDCSKFILWDAAANRLVSIASFRQTAQLTTLEAE